MGILSWIAMGLIVGILARFIMPDKSADEGIITTIMLGIGGAFLGGFMGKFLGFGSVTGFNIGSILLAVGGAVILLVLYRLFMK